MRSTLLITALAALAVAMPRPAPQELEIDAVEALPEPDVTGPAPTAVAEKIVYSSAAVIASAKAAVATDIAAVIASTLDKRDNCPLEPAGSGPVASPDTAAAFAADPRFPAYANAAAAAAPPAGYSLVFKNLQGSTSQAGYAGLITMESYDVARCASECDRASKCLAFDIFIERNPVVNPDCRPDPASLTNFKCTLWNYPIAAASATNLGQPRGPISETTGSAFQVLVAASNGYVKKTIPGALTNFTGPVDFGNAAINAPSSSGSYIGVKVFDTGAFDPAMCAVACQAQTAYNKQHPAADGSFRTCAFFNAYVLLKNGVGSGTTCSLYTQSWDASYATNKGQTRGSDKYTTAQSFGYTLAQVAASPRN